MASDRQGPKHRAGDPDRTVALTIGLALDDHDLHRAVQRVHLGNRLASDSVTFSITRFLAGLGFGGATPSDVAQMTPDVLFADDPLDSNAAVIAVLALELASAKE